MIKAYGQCNNAMWIFSAYEVWNEFNLTWFTPQESTITEKTSECDRVIRQLKTAESLVKSLEEEREKLKEQVSASLSSSSDSTKQLEVLNKHLQDKGKQLEEIQEQLREKESLLSLEKSSRAEELAALNKVKENEREKHKEELQKVEKKIQELENKLAAKADELVSVEKQYKSEQEEMMKKKDLELYELQEQVMTKEAEVSDLEVTLYVRKMKNWWYSYGNVKGYIPYQIQS